MIKNGHFTHFLSQKTSKTELFKEKNGIFSAFDTLLHA